MERYWSTFSHGLSDNVLPPLTRTRTRTDGSDSDRCTMSSVSFKSDHSKKDIITFNKTPSLLRPYSPGVSMTMESYWSPFVHELSADPSPLELMKKERESYWPTVSTGLWDMETRTSYNESDCGESTTSSVSFKSDLSKEDIINLGETLSPPRKKMKRKQTRTSYNESDCGESTTSSVSFKSDLSKEDIINFRETLSPPRTRTRTRPSEESATANVSFKKDQSKDIAKGKWFSLRKEMKKEREEMKKELEEMKKEREEMKKVLEEIKKEREEMKKERKEMMKAQRESATSNVPIRRNPPTYNVSIRRKPATSNVPIRREPPRSNVPIRRESTTYNVPIRRESTTYNVSIREEPPTSIRRDQSNEDIKVKEKTLSYQAKSSCEKLSQQKFQKTPLRHVKVFSCRTAAMSLRTPLEFKVNPW